MNKVLLPTRTSLLTRILCTVAWVLVTCWLGAAGLVFLFLVSAAGQWLVGAIVWVAAYVILYGLLFWWTARAYPTWKSWRFGLILQFSLVSISMASAYFLADGGLYLSRPLAVLLPFVISENQNLLAFILSYVIAFAEIAVWQALAICLRHCYDKRKERKQKTSS